MMRKYLKMIIRYIAWLTIYANVMISGNTVIRVICTIAFLALIFGEYFEIKGKPDSIE